MNQKIVLLVAIILVFAAGVFIVLNNRNDDTSSDNVLSKYEIMTVYDNNTVLTDELFVPAGEAVVLKDDSALTTQQSLIIDGAIGCEGGSLKLVAEGSVTINGKIICQSDNEVNVIIVASGGLIMGEKAEIITNGNIQLVDNDNSIRSIVELDKLYNKTEEVSDSPYVVGPLIDFADTNPVGSDNVNETSFVWPQPFNYFTKIAHAQVSNGTTTVNLTGEPIIISGKISVATPKRKNVKRIVVFDFPNAEEVTVKDFELSGPAGRPGDQDTGSCDVKGDNGEDAFRFNAFAPNLIINNFTLNLGDGGAGGEASTGGDCETAKALGGNGGKPGNFKIVASQDLVIKGSFTVYPGRGGAGGHANARGKAGAPGEDGGSAFAVGGKGADNKKSLTVGGTVGGVNYIEFADAVGGVGGGATAEGGKGGDAKVCGQAGGMGGMATAQSGSGGDAKLIVSGGAKRMTFATDIGGQGGIVEAYGGRGGNGGSCDETEAGGDGGRGGNAEAETGKGGLGKSGRANDGSVFGSDGGAGGRGGDGCVEGVGGSGGKGDIEDGKKGEDGKNTCLSITKEEDYISLLPGEIQVIKYDGQYIPITNLIAISDPAGEECAGEEHWHPGSNGAVSLDGNHMADPDPNNCGFGKVSEVEVKIVIDPNYDSLENGNVEGGNGEMIKIDPPTLVIPAN